MAEVELSKLKLERNAGGMITSETSRRPRWRRWLWPVIIFLAVLAVAALVMQKIRTAPIEVEQASVTMAYPYQNLSVLTATGYVVAQRKAAVASKATGRLEWLGVAEGSRVKRGEVIARLESKDVSATRDQARASLEVARANLEQSQVEVADALRAFNRSEELLKQGFVSGASHDVAKARLDKSRAAVNSLKAAISVAQANVRAADVSVEQTLIRAPFDGVVLTKSANIGDVVTPFSQALDTKGAVLTMADMTTLEVEADVSESSLGKVKLDQPVEIQLDALPEKRFKGTVARMVPTVDRAKATVMTKIRFGETDPRVLPEMSAKVTFLSGQASEAQRVPRVAVNPKAIATREGKEVAYAIVDGVVREVVVNTGGSIGDLVEVTEGLKSGDKVVLNPSEKVRTGTKVKSPTP